MNATAIAEVLAWGWLSQGTFCLSLGLMGSLLWRRHAARAHQVLRLGMLAAIMLPLLSLLVHHQGLGLLPAAVEPERVPVWRSDVPGLPTPASQLAADPVFAMDSTRLVTEPVPFVLSVEPEAKAAVQVSLSPRRFSWKSFAWAVWLVVGLVLLLRLSRTAVLALRLLRGAEPCERPVLLQALQRARTRLSVQASVTLKESRIIGSPVIWCWRSGPVILVQRDIACGPNTDWVSVFCHELAHWKRGDHRTGLWAELWFCVFWWHPLVGWAKKRLEILSEQACDDWVLACGQSGPDYAESLLGLVPETQRAFLPTVVGKDKTMKDRIIRIIKQQSGNPRVGGAWALFVILLTSFLIVGSAFAQRRAPRPEREQPEGWGGGAFVDRRGEAAERHEGLVHELEEVEVEIHRAVDRLHDLEEEGKGGSDEAHEVRQAIERMERRMHDLRREMQARERDAQPDEEMAEYREKVVHRMEEIRALLERKVRELRELEAVGRRDEARRLRQEIGELERALHETERGLHAIERRDDERMEGEKREAHLHELAVHQRELHEAVRRLKKESMRLGKEHPKQAEIHAELKEIRNQLERIEKARQEMQHPESHSRPELQAMEHRHRELEMRAEGIHRAMEALGDSNPEIREGLERQFHELRAQMERIERDVHGERPGNGRGDLEVRVDELNEKVEHLGNEMRDIRGLLEQLVRQQRRALFEVEEEEVERQPRLRSRREYRDRDDDPDEHHDDDEDGEHDEDEDEDDEEEHEDDDHR